MFEVILTRKELEAENIFLFEFQHPDGSALPPFTAGSHIDVQVRPGLIRQYSLCNHPQERHRYQLGVLQTAESRGGSKGMHEDLHIGQTVLISEPRNLFELEQDASHSLLFAGGIGITPILSMAEVLSDRGHSFSLYYFARSASSAAFIKRVGKSRYCDSTFCQFDDDDTQARLDIKVLLNNPEPRKHLYICGPGGFMDFVLGVAREQQWPEANLHREYFSAPGTPEEQSSDQFEIQVASTGQILEVGPQQTVTDVLLTAGIEIPVSCQQGICGTCVTKVLDGVPDHRDYYLSDREKASNDQFTPCCSRAKSSRLVLDL
ncbi:PDR/VanB family oxidoreductase [Pseudomonas sp. HN11]|uniref:PDR/VanB family oxidoreductase n=1 Tax=Pseudomonas sp. HN11 TaxID=1344094 RepID=UPI001F1917F0|nr:PDR/VanB family oxidoreductase [Pseudomonas sp. HN11]UII69878.1 PDR/VanB family oxidoreductase [Pseudomonas sp. HN11]